MASITRLGAEIVILSKIVAAAIDEDCLMASPAEQYFRPARPHIPAPAPKLRVGEMSALAPHTKPIYRARWARTAAVRGSHGYRLRMPGAFPSLGRSSTRP